MVFVLIFVLGLSHNALSQEEEEEVFARAKKGSTAFKFNKEVRYATVGLSFNSFNYFGDLAPRPGKISTDLSFTKVGVGLVGNYRVGSRVFLRGAFTFGSLQGDDFESADPKEEDSSDRYARNLQFRNRIYELSATASVDLFRNRGFFVRRAPFTPYIFGGLAVFHHNPKAKVPELDFEGKSLSNAGEWVALQPLGTEGQNSKNSDIKPYRKIQISVPFGFGVRAKLNHNFDLAFEVGYRLLFFDYLDDVSTAMPNYGDLDSDLARTLSGRAAERNAVVSGDPRDAAILATLDQSVTSYTGSDGRTYSVVSDNNIGAQRGDKNDNDQYIVTSIHLTYVLGSSFRRPKVR